MNSVDELIKNKRIAYIFSDVIGMLRTNEKLSQDEVARKAHLHDATLGKYERAERLPNIEKADNILRVFGYKLAIVKIEE